MIADPSAFHFKWEGSLNKTWNGPQYTDFRSKHRNGEIPEMCRNCYKGNK